jgi:UDP-N-acetylglucosamine 4-epimerase
MKSVIENKRIVVTGGAGFIGSNLCEHLVKNNTVVCMDNFATGFRENTEPLLSNKNFILSEGDIRSYKDCLRAIEGADIVLQQAALGSVPRSFHDPVSTNEVNVIGFINVLTASRDSGVKRVVYASSSSVYGDAPDLPKKEENIGNQLSPYAVTKYANELYANLFSRQYNMEIIGLRYFNVFGKKQSPEGAYAAAIPKFIKAFLHHESPVIHGDGTQSRDFTYIDNVIQANILAATTTDKNAIGQVYNIAAGNQIELNQLVEIIKKLLIDFDPDIKNIMPAYGPEREGDVKYSLASVEKAKRLLGYKPFTDVEAGLKEAIGWYVGNLKSDTESFRD